MAVLSDHIPIASFYCRQQHICGDIIPKFGDFNLIALPKCVADLQIKDALLNVMEKINNIKRTQFVINCAFPLIAILTTFLCMLVVEAFMGNARDKPKSPGWVPTLLLLIFIIIVSFPCCWRFKTHDDCLNVVREYNGQCT